MSEKVMYVDSVLWACAGLRTNDPALMGTNKPVMWLVTLALDTVSTVEGNDQSPVCQITRSVLPY